MKTIGTILAVTLGLGLIAAGCGDDDSGDGALTAAELNSKATAICTPVTEQVNAALEKVFSGKPDPEAFAAAVTTTVLPAFEKQTDQLADLEPPSEDADAYASYIDSVRAVISQLEADPAAPFTGDEAKLYGPSNEKAKAAGLPDVCLAGPAGS